MQSIWIVIPSLRQLSCLNVLVFIAAIALFWDGNQSCVNNLSSRASSPCSWRYPSKLLEEFFDDPCLAKPLSKKCDSRDIWDVIHNAKADELLKITPVIDLEFEFLVTEIKKLLQN